MDWIYDKTELIMHDILDQCDLMHKKLDCMKSYIPNYDQKVKTKSPKSILLILTM